MTDIKRFDLGWGSNTADKRKFPLWYYGIVISVDDPYNAGRIKVRLEGIDNDVPAPLSLKDPEEGGLPWCEPLLPKFINVIPKVNEVVKVAVFDFRNKKVRREYVGPVIAQMRPPDALNSPFFPTKYKVDNGNSYNGNWLLNKNSSDGDWKIYSNKDDIALTGRRNTDFILRNKEYYDEVILRAGKIEYNDIINNQASQNPTNVLGGNFNLNRKNPAYITVNHSLPQTFSANSAEKETVKKLKLEKDRTHINVVADNVNLISHKGSSKKGFTKTILKGDDVLTQIKTENEKLHPIPYGDVLWEFLTVLRPYIEGHIHKGSRREPDGDNSKNNLIKWFNDNMGNEVTKTSPDGQQYKTIENCNFLSKGVKTN
jgi:hypothetical protein